MAPSSQVSNIEINASLKLQFTYARAEVNNQREGKPTFISQDKHMILFHLPDRKHTNQVKWMQGQS